MTASRIAAGLLERRRKYLMPAYLTYHGEYPVVIDRAVGAYVYEPDGTRLVDGFAGVVTISVGHCHPEVLEAEIAQMHRVQHATTLYLNEAIVDAAEALASTMPDMEEPQCFFTNSGTEATEFAVHLAKLATGRSEVLALRGSFHGRTLMSASLTAQETWRNAGPYAVNTHHVPAPYEYREKPEGLSRTDYECWLLDEVRRTIKHTCGGGLAALIVEPIQGNGGLVSGTDGYYGALVEIVRAAGGLVIADEVQTGFHRTGRWWGSSWWPLRPDIRTMAKGMGNGYPIGGVVAPAELASAFSGKVHFSTYGGNPPAMRGLTKIIEIIHRDGTQASIHERGVQLMTGLTALANRYPLIGEVRGRGLMLGVELVTDRKTKEPAMTATLRVMDACRRYGVLLGKGGLGNVLRIKPPYCITENDADIILEVLSRALTAEELLR